MIQLTKQQQVAVEHNGSPALVIAGAGSGKTRTLTAKIAHLVSCGFDSNRILAITFTNKAAGEMKSRLVHLTGLSAARFPWVRTYHSACYQILKDHCHLLGYQRPLQIYADYQQQKTLTEILVKLNYDKKIVRTVLGQISNAKNSGDPGRYMDHSDHISHIRLADIYSLYEKALRDRNAVDFDDILFQVRNLLRDTPEVREQYRSFFQYVLVDEYQDSNNLQEELTRLLLANGNLFCVGDDWQAIYGFRGSNINHFLSFQNTYKGAQIYKLEENFRSSDEIVQVANDLIGYNASRMEKACFSQKRGGIVETHEFFNEEAEADWVGRKLFSFQKMGIPLEKMAVLYRTKFCSLAFEKAFRRLGLQYRMMGSKGFFDRKEILDINCYLTAAVFPKDDVAFERIINIPKRGLGPAMITKIGNNRKDEMSLQDAARWVLSQRILSGKNHQSLSALFDILDDIKHHPPGKAVEVLLRKSDYLDYLRNYSKTESDYTTRVENIDELRYTASQKETIADYLEEASLIREDREEETENPSSGVNLSTIHASKGLEYFTVFISGCEEDLFPHWRSKNNDDDLQEERRLMYVAITRAERYLFLSCSQYRKGEPTQKSRFLEEIEHSICC